MPKLAYVLAATDVGPMIVNRYDRIDQYNSMMQGLGGQLLERGSCDAKEIEMYKTFIMLHHRYFGEGMQIIDCGANIGTVTLALAGHMGNTGTLLAFEAQERLFYCLAGNIALGNHHHTRAIWSAVGDYNGTIQVPNVNYLVPGSFGSLELREADDNEFIGQQIDYTSSTTVPIITIDSLQLQRLDLLKIDVERMEIDVLNGAKETIARCKPILAVEHLKLGVDTIADWLVNAGYEQYIVTDYMVIGIHPTDPTLQHVFMSDNEVGEGHADASLQ